MSDTANRCFLPLADPNDKKSWSPSPRCRTNTTSGRALKLEFHWCVLLSKTSRKKCSGAKIPIKIEKLLKVCRILKFFLSRLEYLFSSIILIQCGSNFYKILFYSHSYLFQRCTRWNNFFPFFGVDPIQESFHFHSTHYLWWTSLFISILIPFCSYFYSKHL